MNAVQDDDLRTPLAFNVTLRPHGPVCNLDCGYCDHRREERLYPGADYRMSEDLLETFTREYAAAQQVPEVTFTWKGGEPLMVGLDFFERALGCQERYRRRGMAVRNVVQTNGALLDDDWCRFFQAHDFVVGISIDGPPELHDAYRLDRESRPTHERVMAGVELLNKHDVDFNTLTRVHAANAGFPLDVYRFLRDQVGPHFTHFVPVVLGESGTGFREGGVVAPPSVTGEQYGAFLCTIFDEWVRRDVGTVSVQTFDAALAAWAGESAGLCIFEETCGSALVVDHNGDVYSCDHFVEPGYHLGTIGSDNLVALVTSEKQSRFGLDKRESLPRYCRECSVKFVCNGGCPRNRFLTTPDGEPGLNYLCDGYRALFDHVRPAMQFMLEELQEGRSPVGIMYAIAQQDALLHMRLATAGPDDPCPCGSGRKFRHCHGR